MEKGYYSSLQFRTHIYQNISATYQIHSGERRVLDKVVNGKDHHLSDFIFNLIMSAFLDKKA